MAIVAVGVVGGVAAFAVACDWASKKIAHPGVAGGADRSALVAVDRPSSASASQVLVVFGATGGSGLAVIEGALAQGYQVRVFVRNPSKLKRELPGAAVEVVRGDLADLPAVEAAVDGATAVICVAGASPETAPGPMAAAVPAMVQGCRRYGVRKLIVQACALCLAPGERSGIVTQGRLIRSVVKYQQWSSVITDNEAVMRFLHKEARDLDWVVSRPPGLLDGDSRGPLMASLEPYRSETVSYSDMADWTLAQVASDAYVGKMPRLYYVAAQPI